MKPRIFIDRPVALEIRQYLAAHCELRVWESTEPISRSELLREVADVHGLLTSGAKINEELLSHAPLLKTVSTISVGYNHFDLQAMAAHGVIGTNTPNVLNDTVADLVLALMLGTARRIAELDQYVKSGKWARGSGEALFGVDVHHATLGLIGMGRIGEAIAKRARFGFDMEIVYHNRNRKPDAEARYDAKYVSLEELLGCSDFVVLMVPLTQESMRMFGAKHFEQMKSTAIFINASRGQTVDESALIAALQQQTIRAAGLDVFDREPIDPSNPLLQLPNAITLPHIGSATAKTRLDMAQLAARNLVAALEGQAVPNRVDLQSTSS